LRFKLSYYADRGDFEGIVQCLEAIRKHEDYNEDDAWSGFSGVRFVAEVDEKATSARAYSEAANEPEPESELCAEDLRALESLFDRIERGEGAGSGYLGYCRECDAYHQRWD